MLKLVKILKENKVKYVEIYTLLQCSLTMYNFKIALKVDFTIDELEKIKAYLVNLGAIPYDYDIGEFLEQCGGAVRVSRKQQRVSKANG